MKTAFKKWRAPTNFRPARGGTKFRHLKIHDTVCLLKERDLLKGKKVCSLLVSQV